MYQGNILNVFLDTDVAFDIISKREPFFHDAVGLLQKALTGQIILHISESTISTLLYLSEAYKINDAEDRIMRFIGVNEVLSGGKQIILNALASDFRDKEDAIQYFIALRHDLDYFITRNIRDYDKFKTSIPVFSPAEFLEITDG